jgi:hypothetical protein
MLMYCAPSGLVGCGGSCSCYVFIGLHPMLMYFAPSGLVGCGGACPCYVFIGLHPMLTCCAHSGLVGEAYKSRKKVDFGP